MKHLTHSVLALCAICFFLTSQAHSEPEVSKDAATAKQALAKLGGLIGEWRGTGQVRRGSTKGAWRESGEFVWDFSKSVPSIKYVVADGKHLSTAMIHYDVKDGQFLMTLQTTDETEETLAGAWEKNKLVFASESKRITITPLNEKRTLVLHEASSGTSGRFSRVGEVGYTRAGTRLAVSGGGQRECVVTGGTGTSPVMYMGETYYVCCSGCKQAFDDDPAGIIAEFKARLAEKKSLSK